MVIHIYYQNKLEGEALSHLLNENGYTAVRQNNAIPFANGSSVSPRPGLYLLDVLTVGNSWNPEPGFNGESRVKTVLLGSIRELYYFFKFPFSGMGFISKSISVPELLTGINRIRDGELFFGTKVKEFISMTPFEQQKLLLEEHMPGSLTTTELDVIYEVAREKTTRQIAREFYRSVHTINNHRKNIMAKLGIDGTFGLGVFAKSKQEEIETLIAVRDNRYEFHSLMENDYS